MDINSFALGYSAGKKGGVALNIAYGDTPPEDTTKLWVKTGEIAGARVGKPVHAVVLPERMPQSQSDTGSAVIGSKIYAMLGRDAGSGAANKSTCFDTETGTASALPNAPFAGYGVGAAAVGAKVYLFGV